MWTYFADCLTKTSNTFIVNAHIFGKVYFPRLVIPISVVISNMIRFIIQFSLFIAVLVYYILQTDHGTEPNAYLLLLPLLLIIMAGLGLGLGIIVSSLTTKYRDLSYLVGFAVQLLMFLSPVIYPVSLWGEHGWIMLLNPMSSVIEAFRYGFMGTGSFPLLPLCYSFAVTVLILAAGTLLFNRVEKSFMDTI
jgi:lipopolysaccharide transport system permease protein